MYKQTTNKRGFTLIELLTVIAILAILGAIIFPTVGQFRTLAKKTSDSNDLRNIVQASQLFAAQYGERLVGTEERLAIINGKLAPQPESGSPNGLGDVAALLAFGGELEDPQAWVSANESLPTNEGLYTYTEGGTSVDINYGAEDFSFSYVVGLRTSASANTPVAFTRQSGSNGEWADDDPYGSDGGHVAFLGGNVSWYDTLSGSLIGPDGSTANSIDEAKPDDTELREAGGNDDQNNGTT